MKAFVITIKDNEKSVAVAQRCIDSGKVHGLDVEMHPAVTERDDPYKIAENYKIPVSAFENNKFSRTLPCLSTFLSHHSLWRKCWEEKEELVIFEHDAVVTDAIPRNAPYRHIMNIGRPSYGRWNEPRSLGVNPLTTKPYMPGAHAYMIKPAGAEMLLVKAQMSAEPTDIFIKLENFPTIQEYYPFCAEARDSFSTIQKEKGLQAKHNYNEKYRIIDA